jgi:diguanylate cyclase (GGDEF)-like protein
MTSERGRRGSDPADTPTTPFLAGKRPQVRREIRVLRVAAGADLLRFALLGDGETVEIGRDDACAIVLSDASVSRKHARVVAEEQGVRVEDLGSTNGTAVNGQPVTAAPLRPGDRLDVGNVPIRFELMSLDEIEHLRILAERLQSSERDALTGLLTRAWLDDGLPGVLERSEAAVEPVSCLFFDIDHFKAVNDTYGHAVGDEALQQVARIVMFSLRDRDSCVRYGGEEIVVVVEDSNEARAALVAERVRRSVQTYEWSRIAAGLALTVSCGVAARRAREAPKDWIARADQALYAAKKGGRNQVRQASS